MHKDQTHRSGEHKVWRSRQIMIVKPVPETESVHKASNRHFGLGILGLDSAHPFAALFLGEGVHAVDLDKVPLKHSRPCLILLQGVCP